MKMVAAVLAFIACGSGSLSAYSGEMTLPKNEFTLSAPVQTSGKQVSAFTIGYETYTADWELEDSADAALWIKKLKIRQKQYYIGVSMDHEDVGFDARLGLADMFGEELFDNGGDFHTAASKIFFHVGLDVPVINTNLFAIGPFGTFDYYPLVDDEEDVSGTVEEQLEITNYWRGTFGVLFKKNPIDAPFRFEWGPMYYFDGMKVKSEFVNRTTAAIISDFDTKYEEKGSAGLLARATVVLSDSIGFSFEIITRSKVTWSLSFDILF